MTAACSDWKNPLPLAARRYSLRAEPLKSRLPAEGEFRSRNRR
jgi:hypothetical protein